MSQLREKMTKAMELRNFSPRTQTAYLSAVANLSKHYMKSPEKVSQDEIEDYLLYLKNERKLSYSTRNQVVSGLKFLFNQTLKNPDMELQLPRKKTPVKLPEVLSVDEVKRVINATGNMKHRLILMTAYSAGLRVGEVVRLKPRHIISSRMLIFIEGGKGVKDRYTLLSQTLLENLRHYWQGYRPSQWLFPFHCLIPGGALAADKSAWFPCPNNYLFSQLALSRVFRGKFMDYLNQAYENGELVFAGNSEKLATKSGFNQLKAGLWTKNWVVDIQEPIDRPENVLEYVGRYTHRVAISNDRLISLKDGKVTFAYKNRETKKMQTMTLDAVEFIRRFLLHVLPKKFMRIRHYGLLANRCKRENLSKCRKFLNVSPEPCTAEEKSIQILMLELTGLDITRCPECKKGTMKKVSDLPQRLGQNPFYLIHPEGFKDTG